MQGCLQIMFFRYLRSSKYGTLKLSSPWTIVLLATGSNRLEPVQFLQLISIALFKLLRPTSSPAIDFSGCALLT